jgi:hypothetical protein
MRDGKTVAFTRLYGIGAAKFAKNTSKLRFIWVLIARRPRRVRRRKQLPISRCETGCRESFCRRNARSVIDHRAAQCAERIAIAVGVSNKLRWREKAAVTRTPGRSCRLRSRSSCRRKTHRGKLRHHSARRFAFGLRKMSILFSADCTRGNHAACKHSQTVICLVITWASCRIRAVPVSD